MRGLRLRLVVATTVPLVIGVLLATLMLAAQRKKARLEADSAVRATVASAVTRIGAAIQLEIATAAEDSPRHGDATRLAADTERRPDLRATAATARDSGRPVVVDTTRPATILVPVYAEGRVPASTADRRQALTGYRLVPLSMEAVLARLLPAHGGLLVRGPTRDVLAVPAPMPASARSFSAGLELPGATGWAVAAWRPEPGTPGVAWLWVLGFLALFGGLAAAAASLLRRSMLDEARRGLLDRRSSLISGMAPVVQSSLDLGEVAPAVSAHLVHQLSLAGISLSVPSEAGERPVFSWGLPADPRALPGRERLLRLEPGRTFAVSLTRGGRILGVLRVVAGETLLAADLDALATATELLASTLSHVEIFARQQQVVERLRAVDELKTVFLATASHELRTPVTAIVGFSTLLLGEWDELEPEQGRMFMERVLSNARELAALVEQLLDFARLERGARPADGDLVDVGSTIAAILAERPELAAGHELHARLPAGWRIRGSKEAVERIVTNLVGNAAKYSPPGTRIAVTVQPDGERVALMVDDEGPGVSAEDREHVFSRFYRGHGQPVTSTRGAGIGLAIVAEYAAFMGGIAAVAEAPGGGARFTVSFPTAESGVDAPGNGALRVPIS